MGCTSSVEDGSSRKSNTVQKQTNHTGQSIIPIINNNSQTIDHQHDLYSNSRHPQLQSQPQEFIAPHQSNIEQRPTITPPLFRNSSSSNQQRLSFAIGQSDISSIGTKSKLSQRFGEQLPLTNIDNDIEMDRFSDKSRFSNQSNDHIQIQQHPQQQQHSIDPQSFKHHDKGAGNSEKSNRSSFSKIFHQQHDIQPIDHSRYSFQAPLKDYKSGGLATDSETTSEGQDRHSIFGCSTSLTNYTSFNEQPQNRPNSSHFGSPQQQSYQQQQQQQHLNHQTPLQSSHFSPQDPNQQQLNQSHQYSHNDSDDKHSNSSLYRSSQCTDTASFLQLYQTAAKQHQFNLDSIPKLDTNLLDHELGSNDLFTPQFIQDRNKDFINIQTTSPFNENTPEVNVNAIGSPTHNIHSPILASTPTPNGHRTMPYFCSTTCPNQPIHHHPMSNPIPEMIKPDQSSTTSSNAIIDHIDPHDEILLDPTPQLDSEQHKNKQSNTKPHQHKSKTHKSHKSSHKRRK